MEKSGTVPKNRLRMGQRNEKNMLRGHLKIYFGYAAGGGKTDAMLLAAHKAKQCGIDVVVGYIETHGRPATEALLNGLECIPVRTQIQDGVTIDEFDLDAALNRQPKLLLLDELAHRNAKGSRHAKRHQDVEELLQAGIHVYTTVNVQDLEGFNEMVVSLTGVLVREQVPDAVFNGAHQVEFVDMPPKELQLRRQESDVYKDEKAANIVQKFSTLENLTALRELALRHCADRMGILTENARVKKQGEYASDEHILVCLSPSPSNAKNVRTAARMAAAFCSRFTALFVETASYAVMSEEDKKRLESNKRLAKQLGALVEVVYSDDIAYQIAEYAHLSGVSKIVVGRSSQKRRRFFGKPFMADRLADMVPGMEIYIIPDAVSYGYYRERAQSDRIGCVQNALDTIKSMLILGLATAIGLLFLRLGFTQVNIIAIYILGVLIISVFTSSRVHSLAASIISVLVFNFCFISPKFTFVANDKSYVLIFATMLITALLTGTLARKLKMQAKQSAQSAFRTKVLFDTNRLLQKAHSDREIENIGAQQLLKLLKRNIVVYPVTGNALGKPRIFSLTDRNGETVQDNEKAVAAWAMQNNRPAGATTNTLGDAKCLYLSVRLGETVYGVIGIYIDGKPLDSFESSVVLSIIGECALALENSRNAREKEQAAVHAQNEQLRANLLRAISHDLRTPLTSISGNASNLLSNGADFDENTQEQIYQDIYDDAMWLIGLVENLLSITRIEEGKIHLKLSTELMDEVISEALRHVSRKSEEHHVIVESSDDFILAKMDARLITQVIINIVDNAIKYTQIGSTIIIRAEKKNGFATVSIADDGAGIPDELKPHVFEMFFSGANRIADSRRSLGLGLSLCKSIITAHGGEITLEDNVPRGTICRFSLPAGEVEIHE